MRYTCTRNRRIGHEFLLEYILFLFITNFRHLSWNILRVSLNERNVKFAASVTLTHCTSSSALPIDMAGQYSSVVKAMSLSAGGIAHFLNPIVIGYTVPNHVSDWSKSRLVSRYVFHRSYDLFIDAVRMEFVFPFLGVHIAVRSYNVLRIRFRRTSTLGEDFFESGKWRARENGGNPVRVQ